MRKDRVAHTDTSELPHRFTNGNPGRTGSDQSTKKKQRLPRVGHTAETDATHSHTKPLIRVLSNLVGDEVPKTEVAGSSLKNHGGQKRAVFGELADCEA